MADEGLAKLRHTSNWLYLARVAWEGLAKSGDRSAGFYLTRVAGDGLAKSGDRSGIGRSSATQMSAKLCLKSNCICEGPPTLI